ncbi:MAG: hypothetical protein ACTHJU_04760 [Sphingopyxis sp.]
MMDSLALLVAFVALLLGALIGWLLAGKQAGALKAERDGLSERFRAAVTDLAAEAEARKAADLKLAALLAEQTARDEAQEARIAAIWPWSRPKALWRSASTLPTASSYFCNRS